MLLTTPPTYTSCAPSSGNPTVKGGCPDAAQQDLLTARPVLPGTLQVGRILSPLFIIAGGGGGQDPGGSSSKWNPGLPRAPRGHSVVTSHPAEGLTGIGLHLGMGCLVLQSHP